MARKWHAGWPPQKRGTENPNAKLSDGQVRFIKYLLRLGATQKRTAQLAKTSASTVGRIATGQTWTHIE